MSCGGCKNSGDSSHGCSTNSKGEFSCDIIDTCEYSYKLSVFDWLANIKSPLNECEYVEVRFKNERKNFYHNIDKLPLHIGSIVTVESSSGYDVGVVSLTGELVRIQMKKKNFGEEQASKIIRIATQKDVEIWQNSRKKEEEVKKEARKIALNLNLEMKISDIEYQGDGSKITFYYTADGRVDFRQLIKEYAAVFRAKVDMKQIGYRQEAAKLGGIGSCGRELCCSTWLTDFRSVNTNAARYQQLSINPLKLAGQCGKLKCCLNFELDSYMDALSHFPSSSTVLDTEKGKAFCIKIDVFKKRMWFAYVDNSILWYDLDIQEVKEMISINKKGNKIPPLEEYKTQELSAPTKEIDLIQENNIDRFEKKKSNKKPKNKEKKNTSPKEEKNNNTAPKQNNSEQQKPNNRKNNKKRNNPKKNNNDG